MESIYPTTVQVSHIKVLSQKAMKLWEEAVWTVKEAQDKFIKAYRATLTEVAGKDWQQTWRTNPQFPRLLKDVEEEIKDICRKHGMKVTTFNRYRNAARKTVLLGIPFDLSKKLALYQLQDIETSTKHVKGAEKEVAVKEIVEQINRDKKISAASAVVSKVATVLPLPEDSAHPKEYLDGLTTKIHSHLAVVRQRFGEKAVFEMVNALLRQVTS